jgi:hypothetical protein
MGAFTRSQFAGISQADAAHLAERVGNPTNRVTILRFSLSDGGRGIRSWEEFVARPIFGKFTGA